MNPPNEAAERRRIMFTAVAFLIVLVGGIGAAFYFVRFGGQGGATAGGAHQQERVERPEGKYVGSAKCATCHAEISEKYALSAKAHSLLPTADAEVIEDYKSGSLLATPRNYRVERTADGKVIHHEFVTGVYDQAEEINYVLGSGKRERKYVLERSGLLLQSPVVWRADEERWAPASEFDASAAGKRFENRITDKCLRCHAGSVESAGLGTDRYKTPPFLESHIGCESCHGPGSEHVAKFEANPNAKIDKDKSDETIVNPAKLGSRRVDHLCASCHLHGFNTVTRYGASLLDFRPGMLLDDVFSVMLPQPKSDTDFRLASHPTQMRASNCYIRSEGGMNCQTCHDPHGDPPAAERPSYFNSACSKCHADQGCKMPEADRKAAPAAGSCIDCHMPKIETNTSIHSTWTDHRIRTRPDRYVEEVREMKFGELQMYDGGGDRVDPAVMQRALNLTLLQTGLQSNNLKLAEKATRAIMPTEQKPDKSIAEMKDDLQMVSLIARMLAAANQRDDAVKCWNQILEYYPEHEDTLVWVARDAFAQKEWEKVLELTDRWQKIHPRAPGAFAFRAMAFENLDRLDEAIEQAERVIELNPTSVPMREWLVEAYRKADKEELAEAQEALLERYKALTQSIQP